MFVCNNFNSLRVYVLRRKKALSGVKMLPDRPFHFMGSDRIITVVYHKIALSTAIPRLALKSLKREISAWVLL